MDKKMMAEIDIENSQTQKVITINNKNPHYDSS